MIYGQHVSAVSERQREQYEQELFNYLSLPSIILAKRARRGIRTVKHSIPMGYIALRPIRG